MQMGLFKRKTKEQQLTEQKDTQFKKIDEEMNQPHHTADYKKTTKASWLASRAANLAEQGDLPNAANDMQEALRLDPNYLMTRVAAMEVLLRAGDLKEAIKIIEETPKKSLADSHSAMANFSFYDRATAIYTSAGEMNKAVLFAKRSLEILNSSEYEKEDQHASQQLGQPREDIEEFKSDIEKFISENSNAA